MLSNLATGKLQSQLIVIQDSIEQSGTNLLRAFTHQLSCRDQHSVHILCFENHIANLHYWENSTNYLHDCFSDHRGWNNDSKEETSQLEGSIRDCSLLEVVQKACASSVEDCVIIVDSLSPVIFSHGVAQCYRDLHSLLNRPLASGARVCQFVCVVHADLVPDRHSTLQRLRHLATTYLQVEPPTKEMQGSPIVSITHRKQGGKVVKQVEQFCVDSNNCIYSWEVVAVNDADLIVSTAAAVQELTTFKLGLGLKEKQARSRLVLPYLRPESQVSREEKGGQVFYQPDAADDWDEEDPDDDLNV